MSFNALILRQNGCNFADNIFKTDFLNENYCIAVQISLKYITKDPIDNRPSLAQIMAWCWTGKKPLSEPMLAQFGNTDVSLGFNELRAHKVMNYRYSILHWNLTGDFRAVSWHQTQFLRIYWLLTSIFNGFCLLTTCISMAVTPVHEWWSYCSLRLIYGYVLQYLSMRF